MSRRRTSRRAREAAKQLSLSLLYWLQTEAPHPDGAARGYPGLRLRPDVVGTEDGLAKSLYIRESRRIRAEVTVCEQHISSALRAPAEVFADSVGIGCYRIDLHPSTGGDNYVDIGCCPFQIPLGALLPVRVENLLPACKNLGVTHITNGAYRLHPVEWAIGEAAGALAAFCLDTHTSPRAVRADPTRLADFQARLRAQGVPTDGRRCSRCDDGTPSRAPFVYMTTRVTKEEQMNRKMILGTAGAAAVAAGAALLLGPKPAATAATREGHCRSLWSCFMSEGCSTVRPPMRWRPA